MDSARRNFRITAARNEARGGGGILLAATPTISRNLSFTIFFFPSHGSLIKSNKDKKV